MLFIFYVLAGILILLSIEKIILIRSVRRIPIRVHVNGSRGKSSVTRYIAAGLRAQNIKTLAKITGERPTLIFEDGTSKFIKRKGAARIQEQIRLLRYAARKRYQAFILECMSINPEFQQIELNAFKPQIYVLTNILDDHQEVIGRTPEHRAAVYGHLLPQQAKIITVAGAHSAEMSNWARVKNSKFIEAPAFEHEVPSGAHRANIALALEVCQQLGTDKTIALTAIIREAQRQDIRIKLTESVDFINGFAINDVASAQSVLKEWRDKLPEQKNLVIIFNSRSDRPVRSRLFSDWLATLLGTAQIILAGKHAPYLRRRMLKLDWPKENLKVWNSRDVAKATQKIKDLKLKNTLIFGLGNIQGDGFRLLQELKSVEV